MKVHNIVTVLFVSSIFFNACKNESNTTVSVSKTSVNSNAAVQVTLKNQLHTITQDNLEAINVSFKNDVLQFSLRQSGNPFQLNINLNNTDLLTKGSESYKIPDVNVMKSKVDLNFYNADRKVKDMNKRIIFRKGTINISEITPKDLQMTFEGEGSGMMEYNKNFPISGNVNITF